MRRVSEQHELPRHGSALSCRRNLRAMCDEHGLRRDGYAGLLAHHPHMPSGVQRRRGTRVHRDDVSLRHDLRRMRRLPCLRLGLPSGKTRVRPGDAAVRRVRRGQRLRRHVDTTLRHREQHVRVVSRQFRLHDLVGGARLPNRDPHVRTRLRQQRAMPRRRDNGLRHGHEHVRGVHGQYGLLGHARDALLRPDGRRCPSPYVRAMSASPARRRRHHGLRRRAGIEHVRHEHVSIGPEQDAQFRPATIAPKRVAMRLPAPPDWSWVKSPFSG